MNMQEYVEKMKRNQEYLMEYIDKEQDEEENYQNLLDLFNDQKIFSDKQETKAFLYILAQVSSDHHRCRHFYEKIQQIILLFKDCVKNFFSNIEIFNIFKKSKILLRFLQKEQMIIIDKDIILKMLDPNVTKKKYLEFFPNELKSFYDSLDSEERDQLYGKYFLEYKENYDLILSVMNNIPEDLEEKGKNGQNKSLICEIIRNDLIEDFIEFIKKENYPLDSIIEPSNYETNLFLLKNSDTTLIEYSAFFGSIEIFKYLHKNGAKVTNLLWLYLIHGNNYEIIHFLEENEVKPSSEIYEKCLKESIKCHHNDLVNYIMNNVMKVDYENIDYKNNYKENIVYYCFHYHNFAFLPKEMNNIYALSYACKFDYFAIVKFLKQISNFDINTRINKILFYFFHVV